MASIESLIFDIVARDRASDGITRISKASDSAAGSTDTLNRRLDELGKKTAQARVSLAGDKEAQASLDKIDAKLVSLDRRTASPNLKVEGAARAIAEISAVDLELEKLGGKGGSAETATSAVGTGGLAGPTGIAALIGAGVVLSPIVATLSTGLAGFGLAAYGVAKPIENAASKTGGLAANMKLLDPEQRTVALGILALGQQYDQFQKTLKPEVLSVFAGGLQLAGHLLHDVQPVAVATGKAFDIMLGRIDAEFQSQTWQNFFGFMARTAGPDMQLLTGLFTSLAADLPPLLTGLQPVASEFITLATGAANAVGILAQLASRLDQVGASAVKAAEITSGSTGPGDTLTNPWKDFTNFLGDVTRSIPGASRLVTALGGGVTEAGIAAANAGAKVGGMGATAAAAAQHVATLAQQVSSLTNAENKAISPLLAYSNALIAQQNDAANLNTALKTSHDRIGLSTAAQRASFSAANTYIQDLLNTASAASKSGQGVDAQISAIKGALPQLEHVKGGTKAYWQEVSSLVSWLHRLQQQKQIYENVFITGRGTWSVGGTTGLKAAAAGMYVNAGTSPVADDVIARVSRGELVVPAKMVSAGLVDHLRGSIPGFAAGGYAGPLKGLQPWASSSYEASIRAVTAGIAGGLARQLTASASAGGAGVARWAPVILQALAMLRQDSSNLGAVEHRMAQESGGNPFAINLWDINAKRGDPSRGLMQVIGATFARYRSFALPNDIYSPLANVFAGLNYAINAYPGRSLSSVMLQAGGYDSGGFLPPGLSLAWNGTGRPESVTPAGRAGNTYIINVNVAPGGNLAEAGRQTVNAIRAFEQRSGKSWRS